MVYSDCIAEAAATTKATKIAVVVEPAIDPAPDLPGVLNSSGLFWGVLTFGVLKAAMPICSDLVIGALCWIEICSSCLGNFVPMVNVS